MAFPTLTTTIQFGKGPYDGDAGSTTFTTVNALAFNSRIGRTSESEATQPGSATITLDNRQRTFDPTHASGPHYGSLLPARQVRVKATWNSVDYYPFVGWVESWPQTLTPGVVQDIDVPCVDALGLVAMAELPSSVYAATVEADEPLAWWRLGESEGSTLVDATGNGHDGQYIGGATFTGQEGLIAGDRDSAISFDHRTQYARAPYLDLSPFPTAVDSDAVAADGLIYEVWQQGRILQEATSLPNSYPFLLAGRSGPELLWIGYSTDRKLRVGVYPFGILAEYNITASKTRRRHVVVKIVPDTSTTLNVNVWVNGVEQAGSPVSIGTTNRSVLGVSLATIIRSFPTGDTPDLILDEAAVYPASADIEAIAESHYIAGTSPWSGDLTLDRLENVLGLLDLSGLVNATAYPSTHTPTELGSATLGTDPVQYLQRLETTESGRLVTSFNTTDGPRLQLIPRDPIVDSVAATFTDEDGASDLHYETLVLDSGTAYITNSVTVKWGGDPDNSAGSITVRDHDSIATFGIRHRDIDTLLPNQNDARALGEFVLARDAQPRMRVTEMTLLPSADDRLWPKALGLRLGDRVQVKIKPQNVGARVTVDAVVEGIEHSVNNGINEWRTKFLLSALSTSDLAGYWRAGVTEIGDPDARPYL